MSLVIQFDWPEAAEEFKENEHIAIRPQLVLTKILSRHIGYASIHSIVEGVETWYEITPSKRSVLLDLNAPILARIKTPFPLYYLRAAQENSFSLTIHLPWPRKVKLG